MIVDPKSDVTYVILVDKNDKDLGIIEKMEAHRIPLLHRAVSVFVTNSKGDWILQRRAYSNIPKGCGPTLVAATLILAKRLLMLLTAG